ncbi:MAG: NAD(P)-dependent oxidoreductase [Acetanaerobacterium sp.]
MIFGVRDDELAIYDSLNKTLGMEIAFAKGFLSIDTVQTTKGFDAVLILTNCRIDDTIAAQLADCGVRYILSRAAGTDHIDLKAVARHGLQAANVPFYSAGAVSEHTVMLLLMVLRRARQALHMVDAHDFTLTGLRGRELRNLTVGVFGAGRIGAETIRLVSGFGARVLVSSLEMSDETRRIATPVSREALFSQSDVLIFHCGLSEDTRHIINKASIATLRDGVVLVNTARGGLLDHAAVLEGLKSGKIAGFAMDVYEDESSFMRKNLGENALPDPVFAQLLMMENVIFTAHMSFFTDTAIANMIAVSLQNAAEYDKTGRCQNELTR